MSKRNTKTKLTVAASTAAEPDALSPEFLRKHRDELLSDQAKTQEFLQQLQTQASNAVGRLNQLAGAIATMDKILASPVAK